MQLRHLFIAIALFCGVIAASADTAAQKIAAQKAVQIDALLEAHWKTSGVRRNAPASDEVFLRRIYLDLSGRIPTPSEANAFLQNTKPDKRAALVDALLESDGYTSRFYNFWADVLRYKSNFINTANVVPAAYEKFIKTSLRENKPYDQFVREMLAARGYAWDDGAVGYYLRDPEMPLDNMALTTRVFLGTRIECAQCHNHPFDKWKQTEFYHLAAFTNGNRSVNEAFGGARDAIRAREQEIIKDFNKEKAASTDGGKAAQQRRDERFAAMQYRKVVGIIKGCVGQLFSPVGIERRADSVLKLPREFKEDDGKPGDIMKPVVLTAPAAEVTPGQDTAEVFARWLTSPENKHFNRVIVNRLWKVMFGVALIEPLDDLRGDSEAMVPELEEHLAKLMVAQRYDMRAFLRVIANTKAYQSAASPGEYERGSTYHFTGPVLRRMNAEQIWDSLVTLGSYEPDARDLIREAQAERRIQVSRMAFDAYMKFDGTKLLDMATARLAAENELEKREVVVREALVEAKRSGDKTKEIDLRHQEGALSKERGESFVRDFILPVLTNLAQIKNGPDAVPVVDELYKVNPNPRVLPTETWKRLHVTGYGPPPKTAAQVAAEVQADKERLLQRAAQLGFDENERGAFVTYCERTRGDFKRASELESPAPRGHLLRTMGQSDRDFVENANSNASIPQALALMNGDLLSDRNLLSPYSPLMHFVNRAATPEAKLDAVYLALLARRPTAAERARWNSAAAQGLGKPEDIIHALINTKQFLFVQ